MRLTVRDGLFPLRLLLPVVIALLAVPPVSARLAPEKLPEGIGAASPPGDSQHSLVFDGSFVHNVGELHMNITNFGVFGSYPSLSWPMSDSPSAQWPAGSGVEYLWSAGVWTGAKISGVPHVSTPGAHGGFEFRPEREDVYTLYRTFEGTRGGNRLPSPAADDDNDGMVDEDPIDGLDNDNDGSIDEDYAAISNQMFRCSYRDDLPESFTNSSDHQPLNVEVFQESYQWENDRVDDFVGVEFTIFNRGETTLEDFFLAFFADPDIGKRGDPNIWDDDLVSMDTLTTCVRKGSYLIPVTYAMGIAYDDDGDEGKAEGHIGIMFMGHTTDASGETAPERVMLRSWQAFSGSASFEDGGDPSNDAQRYALMSAESIDKPSIVPRDYRMMLSAGPFLLQTDDSVKFQVAFVVGRGPEGMRDNAAQAKLTYDGNWFNLDMNAGTGTNCQETYIFAELTDLTWTDPCSPMSEPIDIPKGTGIWVDNDCLFELEAAKTCGGAGEDVTVDDIIANDSYWCSGREGKETQIHWLYGSPPPPPNLRIWPTEGKNVLFWDNFSETIPDVSDLVFDFEGYRIWRADNWDRPYGSSVDNGPSSDLWMLLAEYDQVNGLGGDTGLEPFRYFPNVDANLVAFYTDVLFEDPSIQTGIDALPPVGYTIAEADTAIAIAKSQLGLPGGRSYYRYADTRVHTGMHYFYSVTAMDHVPVWDEAGNIIGFKTGLSGDPSAGFTYTVPQSRSQAAWAYDPGRVYVVPNPVTKEALAPWALGPNQDDPTGLKVEFRHLPAAMTTIRIFTLAGDLVETIEHDASSANRTGDYASTGTATWDLVSRNGQDVASGVYIYSVEAEGFESVVDKFVVIR